MVLRILNAKSKPGAHAELARHYETIVLPDLEKVDGCLYAALLKHAVQPDTYVSMTLWKNAAAAHHYESGPIYRRFLDTAAPFLADSTEWRIQLAEDLTLQQVPVPEEPSAESFETELDEIPLSASWFMRLVTLKIQSAKIGEFRSIYKETIAPALKQVPGCRYAFMIESQQDATQVLSVTIWDSQKEAAQYENGGLFQTLTQKLESTFSETYQWKREMLKDGGKAASSDDISVSGYQMLASRRYIGN